MAANGETSFASMVELSNRAFARRRELQKQTAKLANRREYPPEEAAADADHALSLFERAPTALLIGDYNGNLLDTNGAGLHLLGYDLDSLRQLTVVDIVAARQAWTLSEFGRFARERQWKGQLELRRQDGSVLEAQAVATSVDLDAGSAFVAVVQARPSHGADLRRFHSLFEGTVGALEDSAAPSVDLSKLILGSAQVRFPAIEAVSAQAARLENRIRGLLSATDAQHLPVEYAGAPADLAELLEAIVEETQIQAPRHSIRLLAPRGALAGYWEITSLRRALSTLIGNAVLAAPNGGVVRITATDAGSHVVVSISDEGVGLGGSVLARLFERLAQDEANDLNLSLYVSRRLIEAQGGRMWVESEGPGTGITVCFSLPRWPKLHVASALTPRVEG